MSTSSKHGRDLDQISLLFSPKATKDVNYTQVVFSAPGGQRNDSVLDYENIEEATDYINVKPKSHKPSFWTSVNPGVFERVEYPSGHVNSRLFNGV